MRVLHLDSGREMRGGQWQALRLHQGLIEAGHESLLLARENSPLMDAARRGALPCSALQALRLRRLSVRFDLVHAHDARSHTLGALLAASPLVVSRRVAFHVGTSVSSRWKYGRPARFLAVSEFVALQLRNAGIDENRIAVVYDGVPIPPTAAQGDTILVPETLDPAKGMALAEEAARMAGFPVKRSRNLAEDLPHAKALLYITFSEGLGSGILLAMAHGITVIASTVGGIPELIRHGENGLLVQNETAAIAAALRSIDPALGRAARATVIERFSEARMIEHTIKEYERVLGHG